MLDLYPFQKEDVEYLGTTPSVLNMNEMGVGKSYEAIARDLLIREEDDGPTLVIGPLTTLSGWEDHIRSLTNLSVSRVNPKARSLFLKTPADVYLVHYPVMRLMPELASKRWLHVIADECHALKSRQAQQTKATKKLKTKYKTDMSGTPIINRPDELWSILHHLYPKDFRSYWRFFERYVEYTWDYTGAYRIIQGPKNVDELRELIKPFSVRRTKEEVLPNLPEKYYTTFDTELAPKQRRAYEQMRREMLAWVGQQEDQPLVAQVAIAKLIRLQQFALAYASIVDGSVVLEEPSTKLDVLVEILQSTSGQVVVFSQFEKMITLTANRLRDKGISYVRLTGAESQQVRSENIRRFQGGGAQVLLGTIAAGGVGVTLTAASTVCFLDRSWSPALNLQAEDRLHRIGQESAVQVIDILATETVDLGRHQRLELKLSWIRRIIDGK